MTLTAPERTPELLHPILSALTQLTSLSETLKRVGFIYLPALPQSIDPLKLAELLTGCHAILQENGAFLYPVKPMNDTANRHHSQSFQGILPHSDGAYLHIPPRFLFIRGITPASCGGGLTQVWDARPFLRFHLTETEQMTLMLTKYKFSRNDGRDSVWASVLDFPELPQLCFRFSLNNLLYGEPSPDITQRPQSSDPFIQDLCARLLADFKDNHLSFAIDKDAMLIVDNWVCLHARTAFTDPSRHLQRAWLA